MTKRPLALILKLSCLGVATLLGVCFLAFEGCAKTNKPPASGPMLDGLSIVDSKYTSIADQRIVGRLHGSRRPGQKSSRTTVNLDYMPLGQAVNTLEVTGLDIATIARVDMVFACVPAYDGYLWDIYGYSLDGARPRVSVGALAVDLTPAPSVQGMYENLGVRGQFYQSANDHVKEGGELPGDSNSRTFLPDSGERTGLVSVTGRPVFEKSYYAQGVWLGTYAVWRTAAEKDAATIEKSSAMPGDK